ncbi:MULTISPECIES: DUF998 domain-containing protein [Mycobacterium]|uniref:DUF998 domain-containing protein n=1 Tax=Mycobacterium kiyosense TaxID=2871094 RepID=A0A9P3UXM5_9MYCO|nr:MULTISPECIES: DUF998 domain-containing protein [Mycobacterium]BDB39749.1 hypothetical protein IWGMT90018_01950 [Mycobacterium kiyosense]BDE11604.1 hypothetical protein MKCMC460_04640 [Mycobacterium sp. 20KCMC460]GLB81882.1 hypothetical protein SRL2020028_11380 [Mycobacterium kiyosense]GLB88158.1 hypothetical protein SRL2020130_09750 [Mycobacterium kiyosense]GLB95718.1 hypothetical protein SRL2020226_24940 [Mycobacterium kiyosense]
MWLIGVAGFLLLEAAAARGYQPHYSYADNYISELGAHGPLTYLMHLGFYLQGVAYLLGAVLVSGSFRRSTTRVFLALAAANAVGNTLVGAFPGGGLHGIGAALALTAGNAATLAGSSAIAPARRRGGYRVVSKVIAVLGFICLSVFAVGAAGGSMHISAIGVWERGSVYAIFLWQLWTVLCLQSNRPE